MKLTCSISIRRMRCRTECACKGVWGRCPQQVIGRVRASGFSRFAQKGYLCALLASNSVSDTRAVKCRRCNM